VRILVTGASGFIGKHLCRALIREDWEVIAVGRNGCNLPGVRDIPVPALTCAALENSIPEADRIDGLIHLAAAGVHPADRDSETILTVNAELPPRIVAFAERRGARAVVVAGSSAEYRAPSARQSLTEDAPLESEKLYGASKAAGGLLALAAGRVWNIPVGILRLFNVYGPGEAPHRLLPSLAHSLRAGMPVNLSAGTQVRDFVYVDDACSAFVHALRALMAKTMTPGAYNVSSGQGHSVGDFARIAARTLGSDSQLLRFGALPFRPDDVPYLVGEPTKLSQACGWSAGTTLAAGISTTLSLGRDPITL
jgi:nucleoside-diphosphate-sugar epimerase